MDEESDERAGWLVLEDRRILVAAVLLLFSTVILYAALFPREPGNGPPGWAVGVAALVAALTFRTLTQGGCTLRPASRTLTRWGPLVPPTRLEIPYDSITKVEAKGGEPSRINGECWFHVVLEYASKELVIRSMRDREKVMRFAKALAEEVGAEFVDSAAPEQ